MLFLFFQLVSWAVLAEVGVILEVDLTAEFAWSTTTPLALALPHRASFCLHSTCRTDCSVFSNEKGTTGKCMWFWNYWHALAFPCACTICVLQLPQPSSCPTTWWGGLTSLACLFVSLHFFYCKDEYSPHCYLKKYLLAQQAPFIHVGCLTMSTKLW